MSADNRPYVEVVTPPGGLVLDPFMGAGSGPMIPKTDYVKPDHDVEDE